MGRTFKEVMHEQGKEYAREGISLEHLGELNDNKDFLEGYHSEKETMREESINSFGDMEKYHKAFDGGVAYVKNVYQYDSVKTKKKKK